MKTYYLGLSERKKKNLLPKFCVWAIQYVHTYIHTCCTVGNEQGAGSYHQFFIFYLFLFWLWLWFSITLLFLKIKTLNRTPFFLFFIFLGQKKNLISSICANLVYVTLKKKKKSSHQNLFKRLCGGGGKDVISGLAIHTRAITMLKGGAFTSFAQAKADLICLITTYQ